MKKCIRPQQFHKVCLAKVDVLLHWYDIQERLSCGCPYVYTERKLTFIPTKEKIIVSFERKEDNKISYIPEQLTLFK